MGKRLRAASRFRAVIVAVLAMAACTRDAEQANHARSPGTRVTDTATSVLPDSITQPARAAFEAFLEASREGSWTVGGLDSLTRCGDDNTASFPSPMLAAYTVQQLEARGDTAVARASVITVAEQDIDRSGSGFVARQRIRTDVLEWDVYENEWGQWVVCNGLRFGYRGADSLTTWRPEGASYQTSRLLADSIHAVRKQ